ncbi:hypothetical protein [Micromonospora sp. NPDC005205]|uniref:glycoside hydrolase family 2 protein n=1 Tax=Micromonospora sp. NPDC005205 TaxID=3156714 RepID=UPI0033A59A5C
MLVGAFGAESFAASAPEAGPNSPHPRAGLAENTYWRYDKAEQLRALNDLPSTRLSTSSSTVRVVDGRNTVTTTVRNQGRTVAALVRLAVRDKSGERVLPGRYDDNYFWLLPGGDP